MSVPPDPGPEPDPGPDPGPDSDPSPAELPDTPWSDAGEGVLDRSLDLVRFLRERCPWDAAQTPRSLIPHLLEEAHETADAIRADDARALEGELGDLLLNLAFQVVLGEEEERFDAGSIVGRLEEKMKRRHPHLFGLGDREEWETLKARERAEGEGVLEGLSTGLDPLLRAHRIQERVSGVGFDWPDASGAWEKVVEELEEVREALQSEVGKARRPGDGEAPEEGPSEALEEELGDLLFAVVNLTRLAGAHSDTALDRANRKFHRRFQRLEEIARERGIRLEDATLEELDRIWDEVKAGDG